MLEEEFNKRIKEKFSYDFDIAEKGLYIIETTGRAKSWLQNTLRLISFFKDDDLALKIDGREFPKLSGKEGLFDGEVAWNGNKLKNLSQVNIFCIYLDAGKHTLQFIADQSPLLETVRIFRAPSEQNIVFEPVKNYQTESGNRRPSIIFILTDLVLEELIIQASAGQKQSDDDDLQLRINGERQINDTLKSHKYWYWCGRVLKGQSRTFDKRINLPAGLHYIELWADNAPVVEKVELVFIKKVKKGEEEIRPYSYKGVFGNEDYNRYDSVIKEVVDYWNDEFLKDTDSPENILDPNLVKAIMYQESRIGYDTGESRGEIDVMQVGDPNNPALRTLKGELREYWIHNGKQVVLEYPDARVETVRESIYWGVRWLYHKAQSVTTDGGRYWREWKDAMREYGPVTKEYTDSVWRIYKNGIRKENNNTLKLWAVGLAMFLSLANFLLWEQNTTNKTDILKAMTIASFDPRWQYKIQEVEIKFYKDDPSLFLVVAERDKDWWEDLRVGTMLKSGAVKWLEIESPPSEQAILSTSFINLNGFSGPILEIYGYSHKSLGALYLYEIKNDKLMLVFETMAVDGYNESVWRPENYQNYGYSTCGQIYEGEKLSVSYLDINGDGVFDIVLKGKANVICEKEVVRKMSDDDTFEDREVKVSEIIIKKIYLWDKNNQVFVESI